MRCIIAVGLELGNDEVYYWTYSQQLQWNYFDHPPMVGIWIRAFTANLWLEEYEFFVRFGSILSAALSTWLLYRILSLLHSGKAGWYVACLYTTSVYASIIAGVFILPDSPQILFWCWCLYLLLKISHSPQSWRLWILFGLSAGLCVLSKVHGIFIPMGLLLFIIVKKRAWLLLPQLYAAGLLFAFIISPILFWNLNNDFITYRFHSERVTVSGFTLNASGFLREVVGQFLYNNPFNVILLAAALLAWKRLKLVSNEILVLFAYIALPMIALLLLVSLFRNTLPHWSGPAYVTLLPLTSIYLTTVRRPGVFPGLLRSAAVTILLTVIAGLLLVNFYPGTLGKKSADRFGDGDFTLDLYGWESAGKAFATIYHEERAKGMITDGTPVVAYKWFPAAHLDYYFCRPLGIELIGAGLTADLHHYQWMNGWRAPNASLEKAYCIVPSNVSDDARTRYAAYYRRIELVNTIEQRRGGSICRYFRVYRLEGWKGASIKLP
ncbi:MAG: glycosyltransferase family 39 protein [Chitinophagaceae bacterium]